MTYVCIRWLSFLSFFRFIIASLRRFVKAAEYKFDPMMRVSTFLSFAALMKLDLTCLEKVQSENFAIIGRKVPCLFPFAICVQSILLVRKSLSNSGITFKILLARTSFVRSQFSLCWGCLMFLKIKVLRLLLFLDSFNSSVSPLFLVSRASVISTNDW